MNTVMNNRYLKMHTEVIDLCGQHGIRLIAGKRVSYEIMEGREISGVKEFLLIPEDMKIFEASCAAELQHRGYTVVKANIRSGSIYRIYREDMLATTVASLMKNPAAKHSPQFMIRGLTEAEGYYTYTANGRGVSFPAGAVSELEKTEYCSSTVYMKANPEEHLQGICGEEPGSKAPAAGYGLISTECPAADFLKEAEKRGLLSPERIERYNEYTAWKKENRSETEKKYREYQEVLLGLKQP